MRPGVLGHAYVNVLPLRILAPKLGQGLDYFRFRSEACRDTVCLWVMDRDVEFLKPHDRQVVHDLALGPVYFCFP